MKKLLIILTSISIFNTATINLVACNKNTPLLLKDGEYSEEELKELKEKNKLDAHSLEARNSLEGMAPQEKPFNKLFDKGYNPYLIYYIIGRPDENHLGTITEFGNNKELEINPLKLGIYAYYGGGIDESYEIRRIKNNDDYTLKIYKRDYVTNDGKGIWHEINSGDKNDPTYFKGVYRSNSKNYSHQFDIEISTNNHICIGE